MPKKRSSQSGSNSATAKLISRINKFGHNVINNSFDQANDGSPRSARHLSYDDDDDEVFVLTAKQKQQIQRNEYLESLTKEQLKIEAKRRGQKTAGTKTELVQFCSFCSLSQAHELKFHFTPSVCDWHSWLFCCNFSWFLRNASDVDRCTEHRSIDGVIHLLHTCFYWYRTAVTAHTHSISSRGNEEICADHRLIFNQEACVSRIVDIPNTKTKQRKIFRESSKIATSWLFFIC